MHIHITLQSYAEYVQKYAIYAYDINPVIMNSLNVRNVYSHHKCVSTIINVYVEWIFLQLDKKLKCVLNNYSKDVFQTYIERLMNGIKPSSGLMHNLMADHGSGKFEPRTFDFQTTKLPKHLNICQILANQPTGVQYSLQWVCVYSHKVFTMFMNKHVFQVWQSVTREPDIHISWLGPITSIGKSKSSVHIGWTWKCVSLRPCTMCCCHSSHWTCDILL